MTSTRTGTFSHHSLSRACLAAYMPIVDKPALWLHALPVFRSIIHATAIEHGMFVPNTSPVDLPRPNRYNKP